jgi:nitrilase
MRIALVQMKNGAVKQENLDRAEREICEAAEGGADFVVLPEMFCCEYSSRAFLENREPAGEKVWQTLSRAAAANGVGWLAAPCRRRKET